MHVHNTVKTLAVALLILLVAYLATALVVSAQITGSPIGSPAFWKLTGSTLSPINNDNITVDITTLTVGTIAIDSVAQGHIESGYFVATSTTATSTFAGGLTVDSTDFVVDPDGGLVGIGTVPSARLHINGNVLLENNTEIRQKDSGGTERTVFELDSSNDLNIGGSYAGALKFIGGGSYTEVMRINDDGNVGIGTTTPGSKLDIHDGNLRLSDTDIAHGFTTLTSNGSLFEVSPLSGSAGGALIAGYAEASVSGLVLRGLIGAGNPADSTPAVQFRAGKQSGTTGATMGDLETAFQFSDWDGGTDWLTITGNGYVGIGSTTPGQRLSVGGGIRVASTDYVYLNSTYYGYSLGTYPVIQIGVLEGGSDSVSIALGIDPRTVAGGSFTGNEIALPNFVEFMQENSDSSNWDQNVLVINDNYIGVGDSTPDEKLHISGGNLKLDNVGGTSNDVFLQLQDSGLRNWYLLVNGTTDRLSIKDDGAEYMSILPSGNVGIGTATPQDLLHVDGNVSFGGTANNNRLSFLDTNGDDYDIRLGLPANNNFSIYNDTDARYEVVFDGDGNVGIGTTTPAGKLDIYGASPKLSIDASSGSPELQFTDGGVDEFAIYYDTGSNFLAFNEGGIGTHMVIKDGGNVGIGTTTPSAKLTVSGGHQIFSGTAPTVSSCGTTPSVYTESTDNVGHVTAGTGTVNSCTITFATAWNSEPHCIVQSNSSSNKTFGSAETTTTLVITSGSNFAGEEIDWICFGTE